jgi:polyhydroxybutyrate depolymerase
MDAAVPAPDTSVIQEVDSSSDAAMPSTSRSSGCGSGRATQGFEARSITVGGRERRYHIRVPGSYDANRAYPIVFRWHGSGGDGLDPALAIENSAMENAIVVGGDGVQPNGGQYWNPPSDVEFFDGMLETLSGELCLDLTRVFNIGFSSGGGMTNYLSCVRGDVVRAGAAIAGFDRREGSCPGRPAIWLLHDTNDDAVTIDNGIGFRDFSISRNGCQSGSPMTITEDCVQYQGCDAPVVWCQTEGVGHNPQGSFANPAAWAFFSSLP